MALRKYGETNSKLSNIKAYKVSLKKIGPAIQLHIGILVCDASMNLQDKQKRNCRKRGSLNHQHQSNLQVQFWHISSEMRSRSADIDFEVLKQIDRQRWKNKIDAFYLTKVHLFFITSIKLTSSTCPNQSHKFCKRGVQTYKQTEMGKKLMFSTKIADSWDLYLSTLIEKQNRDKSQITSKFKIFILWTSQA